MGSWLSYYARNDTQVERIATAQANLSVAMAALVSGKRVRLKGLDNCEILEILLVSD